MTLEQTRARIDKVKRRRRRVTGICLSLAAAAVAAGIWSASVIMPFYGRWEYEHRRESHDLVGLEKPSYVIATIMYEHDPPTDIMLEDYGSGHRLRDMSVRDDPDAKTVTVACDVGPDNVPGNYSISLIPADNYELKYSVDVQPSYRYMDGDIQFTRDAGGNLWIRVTASYSRCTDERGLRVLVHLNGQSYAPVGYDGFIPQIEGQDPVPIEINLSETALWRKHDLSKVTNVEVTVTGEYWVPDGSEMKPVNFKKAMSLREWPLYDESQDLFAFDMSDTLHYLGKLHLRPPEGRDPIPDPDEPAPVETEVPNDDEETDGE